MTQFKQPKIIKFKRTKPKVGSFKWLPATFLANTELTTIDLDKFRFNTGSGFDNSGYTICNEISKRSHDVSYIPNTRTLGMSNDSFCYLVENNADFIADVGKVLNIDREESINQISEFFSNRSILVQQKGIEGALYKIGTFVQTAGSATMVAKTVSLAKLAGVSGLKLIETQPLLIVVLPTVGAMFFHGCVAIAGPNTIGRTCNSIGNLLNFPMRGCEIIYNSYVSPMVTQVTGISTILNYTEQIKRGPGLTASEAVTLWKTAKNKPYVKIIVDYVKCLIIKQLGGSWE